MNQLSFLIDSLDQEMYSRYELAKILKTSYLAIKRGIERYNQDNPDKPIHPVTSSYHGKKYILKADIIRYLEKMND